MNSAGIVAEVRPFMDGTYAVGRLSNAVGGVTRFDWAQIGVDKFCGRVIPIVVNGTPKMTNIVSELVRNAVTYGSGTAVVSQDGSVRVCSVQNTVARVDPFGDVTYEEKIGGMHLVGRNGSVYLDSDGAYSDTGAAYFCVFHKADADAPSGRSRITRGVRSLIRDASNNAIMRAEAQRFYSTPQRVINGMWDDADASIETSVRALTAGVTQIIGLPRNPDTGELLKVEQFSGASFQHFVDIHSALARDCAAALNLAPAELGVTESNPTSAESLYASKEDLILEVSAFESSVHDVVQSLLSCIAERSGTAEPTLEWAEPATPSKASQADAFVKLAAAIPQLKYSRAALRWAGLPESLADELADGGVVA